MTTSQDAGEPPEEHDTVDRGGDRRRGERGGVAVHGAQTTSVSSAGAPISRRMPDAAAHSSSDSASG